MLERERQDGRHPGRGVHRCAGTAVLADREPDVLDRGPDRVEHRVEEIGAARVEARHHDPAETVLLRPVDVLDCLLDVVEQHRGLAAQPTRRLGAEVGEPPVVGHLAGACEVGVGDLPRIVELVRLERHAVREQHLGDDALGLEIMHTARRVPLGVERQIGLHVAGVAHPRRLRRAHPFVVDVAVLRLDVLAVHRARRLDVSVNRDDRRSRQRLYPLLAVRGTPPPGKTLDG